jgi:hypothetical protein
VRVGCPSGEHIIVPSSIKEHYILSPENWKPLTIIDTLIADGRESLPPFIITPGKKIMENWLAEELIRTERLAYSPTRYINNQILIEYFNYLIEHSRAGPDKPWKIFIV